jgi:hypothetical protein
LGGEKTSGKSAESGGGQGSSGRARGSGGTEECGLGEENDRQDSKFAQVWVLQAWTPSGLKCSRLPDCAMNKEIISLCPF